ncbi:ATP-binding protein [Geobacter sp.]|uniref:magnesium chelatase subunit ChlI family protein n=1 Tax=Geobacter sp. TaxID=46610 RepID=UPI00260341B5|nr:ATP-binding protein [Geobacter sp.]
MRGWRVRGQRSISRALMSLTYPSRFMLVAAMNPCKCGQSGENSASCTCTPREIHQYRSRISGPLLDRIDIHIEVPAVKYRDLADRAEGESSAEIVKRVERAREIQLERFRGTKVHCNAHMGSRQIRKFCEPDAGGHRLLEVVTEKLGFLARAYTRILKVARTIADLEGTESIREQHIAEAIQYRSLDRKNL